MTDLSPAAAAVMIAATNSNFNVVDDPVYKQCIAAALRAAANLVLPEEPEPQWWQPVRPHFNRQCIRRRFLAIVAELEGAGARRPKPPSLKEQALAELVDAYDEDKIDDTAYDTIRRALEQLND